MLVFPADRGCGQPTSDGAGAWGSPAAEIRQAFAAYRAGRIRRRAGARSTLTPEQARLGRGLCQNRV